MHWFKHSPWVDIIVISKIPRFCEKQHTAWLVESCKSFCNLWQKYYILLYNEHMLDIESVCVCTENMFKNWSHSYICIFYTLTETNIDISFRAVSSHFSTLGYHTNIHACKKGNWHTDELSTSVCCQMGMRDMIQLWWARCGSVIQFRPPSVYAEWRGADDLPNDQGCGFYSPFIRTYIFIFF